MKRWLAVAVALTAGLSSVPPAVADSEGLTGARLVIPRLGLDVSIAGDLSYGPVIYWRDKDTVGIAGHRTTYTKPFANLPSMRRGDLIRLAGKRYRVRRTAIVRPWQVWVLRFRGVVLSACHPAGSAAYRFVVLASPVD